MAYFTFLGIWLLLVGRLPGTLHRAWLIPSIFGLLGLLVSGFFIYLMGKVIHSWCGLCLLTHMVNLPLVMGIWILWLQGGSTPQTVSAGDTQATGSTASQLWKIPVMALVIGLAVNLAQIRDAQTTDAVRTLEAESNLLDQVTYMNARKVNIPIDAEDPVLGPANAPHTVVLFSDLQCPSCARFAPIIETVQRELAIDRAARVGKVPASGHDLDYAPFRIVFKHFPLNRTCNKYWHPIIKMADHKYACQAALAAEAARRLGGNAAFWKMHDLLYRNRDRLASEPYKALAEQIGLNGDEFQKLFDDPATMQRIQRDAKEGGQLGVSSTPTIYLDGRRVERLTKSDLMPPMQKTVEMWARLLQYASLLNAKTPATQPSTLAQRNHHAAPHPHAAATQSVAAPR